VRVELEGGRAVEEIGLRHGQVLAEAPLSASSRRAGPDAGQRV